MVLSETNKSVIENQTALVLVVVDLLDFPCSIWPGLADILGTKRPVYVVGNKVFFFLVLLLPM